MKKDIRVTKGQFERLIESVHKEKFSKPLREGYYGPSGPGAGAADGMVVVLDALQQAWKYVTDPKLKTKIKAIIQKKGKKQTEVDEGYYGPSGPGAGAADGMVVVLDALQQAWKYVTDPELKTKIKAIIQKKGKK